LTASGMVPGVMVVTALSGTRALTVLAAERMPS
jgi:hypothetical protein